MFAFSRRRAIHRTVLVTLTAWVFALMAGIANACPRYLAVAVIAQSVAEGVATRGPPGAIRFLRLRL